MGGLSANGTKGRVLARQLCLFDEPNCNDKEIAFAETFIATGKCIEAYIAANGPKTRRATACKMGKDWLQKDHIRAYIEQRRSELALEAGLTQEEVIAYLRTSVLIGLGRQKIRKTLTTKNGLPGKEAEVYDPSLTAANSAAMGLAKFLGIGDESTQNHTLKLSDEDLADELERLAAEHGFERRAAE